MIEMKIFKGPAEYDRWLHDNRYILETIFSVVVYGTQLIVTYATTR